LQTLSGITTSCNKKGAKEINLCAFFILAVYLECVHKVLDFKKIKIFDDFLFFSLQQMLGY
jgi:hypothetical protein